MTMMIMTMMMMMMMMMMMIIIVIMTMLELTFARDVLMLLRDGDTALVEEEMQEIKEEAEAEKDPDMGVMELLRSDKLRVSLVICIVMHLRWELQAPAI